jgi:DNA ligase-1
MIHSAFKPLLAEDYDPNCLVLPKWLSPKYDGIRAVNHVGPLLSRSNKPIPNKAVCEKFAPLHYLDMELIHGEIDELVFDRTTSIVRTIKGSADDVYAYVFDHIERLDLKYVTRHQKLMEAVDKLSKADREYVRIVPQTPVETMDQIDTLEEMYLDQLFEGVMLRDPDARYKCGRSTVLEGILLKVKRFKDAECKIIGFYEQQKNTNAAFINELGHTKRSSAKAGKVGKDTLGGFIAVGLNGRFKDVEFRIGGGKGLTMAKRQEIWANRLQWVGKVGTYEFFDKGSKDRPRHPLWKGERMAEDM